MAPPEPPRAWQRMLSGRRLDLLDPSPLDIEIVDIAHGLARVARWNGQTLGPYVFSVAQHSVLVERLAALAFPRLDPPARLTILLHDAAEYVIGDIISPFKAVLGDGYKAIENRILGAVRQRFSLPAAVSATLARRLKEADRMATFFEATRLAGFSAEEAERFFGRPALVPGDLDAYLTPAPIEAAEAQFLDRFMALERQCATAARRTAPR